MIEMQAISSLLEKIYGQAMGRCAFERIAKLIDSYPLIQGRSQNFFSQQDVILITYGDSLKLPGRSPLSTLKHFADEYLSEIVTLIHILPFFPFSSDDGYAVKDFETVDPRLGTWSDVIALKDNFGLIFDWVLNHISSKSIWFENYLHEKKGFENLAIEIDPGVDLSQVARPRTLPLLTPFKKKNNQTVHLWTTFGPDQIDFNYACVDVLGKMLEVLLLYVQNGAVALRLDAIAYLWKEVGTSCVHLPQTHALVRLFRAVLDRIAPHVVLLTETNVPHEENISYFGNGHNESQMVYNFTLSSLLAYTLIAEDSRLFSSWAENLDTPSEMTTFLNFTASHDGIGLRPLEGILTNQQMERLLQLVHQNGGQLSYKSNPKGSATPYEMNISYFDLLNGDSDSEALQIARFLASQTIMLEFPGVPGIYIHSLLGSRNWQKGILKTGRARSINREKLSYHEVVKAINHRNSLRYRIFHPYRNLIKIRKQQPAFHPRSAFKILDLGPKLFGMIRFTSEQKIYALTNITSKTVRLSLIGKVPEQRMQDLLTQQEHPLARIILLPYQTLWLTS
ncbi:MAG: sugar phosphorylase [Desulfobacteraceae bacterium]|jgi:sucrose phosphorylase